MDKFRSPIPRFQQWDNNRFNSLPAVRKMKPYLRKYARALLQNLFCQEEPFVQRDAESLAVISECRGPKEWERIAEAMMPLLMPIVVRGEIVFVNEQVLCDHARATGTRLAYTPVNEGRSSVKDCERILTDVNDRERILTDVNGEASKLLETQKRTDSPTTNADTDLDKDKEQDRDGEVERDVEGEGEVTGAEAPSLSPPSILETNLEDEMANKFLKELEEIAMEELGIVAENRQRFPEGYKILRKLADRSGTAAVLDGFRVWAKENAGLVTKFPIQAYSRVASGVVNGQHIFLSDPRLKSLAAAMVEISNGEITFTDEPKRRIGLLLRTHSPEDILTVFRNFYDRAFGKDYELRNGGEKFSQTAESLVEALLLARAGDAKLAAEIAEIAERGRLEAQARHAATPVDEDEDEEGGGSAEDFLTQR